MKKTYIILHSSNCAELEKLVRGHLEQGWELQGGVSVAMHPAAPWPVLFAQALTRHVSDK